MAIENLTPPTRAAGRGTICEPLSVALRTKTVPWTKVSTSNSLDGQAELALTQRAELLSGSLATLTIATLSDAAASTPVTLLGPRA